MIGFDEGNGSGGPAAQTVNDELARAIRRAIARGEIRSDREARRFVDRFMNAYNTRAQDELGGLSPVQASRLLYGEWSTAPADGSEPGQASATPALRLATDLSPDDLTDVPYPLRARELIGRIDASGGVRATKAGNLPRAVVSALLEIEDDGYVEIVKRYNKVINEADHPRLHITRIVVGLARLVLLRKGSFDVTRKGRALAGAEEAGALLALLFDTHFRTFNLAFVDGCPETPAFQQTIAYSLWRFGRLGDEWRTPEEWAPLLLLPGVRSQILEEARLYDHSRTLVERRLLKFLVDFGLAEARSREPVREDDHAILPTFEYRKASLFDRFLSFGV